MARGDRVEVVIAAVDKVAAPIRKINRQIETMTAPVRKVQRALRSLGRELHLDKVGTALRGIGRQIGRLAIAGVAGLGAVGYALERLSNRGDKIAKFTRRLKTNAQAYQELEFAADREGISNEEFAKSFEKLARNVGDMKAGTGEMLTLLKTVDPAFAKTLAQTTDMGEAFDLAIKKLGSFKDPMKQAALSAALFGRSGAKMIQLANVGADGIDALRKRARELGFVMSDETLAASEQLNDDLTDLKATVFGLWTVIGGRLMPIVSGIVDRITAWTAQNQELIKTKAVEYVEKLYEKGVLVYDWLVQTIPKVVEMIEKMGGLKTVAIALGVVLAASVIAPLVALVAAVGGLPAALLALGAGVVAFWDDIKIAIQPVLDLVDKAVAFVHSDQFGTGLDTSGYAALAGPAQGMDSAAYQEWQSGFNSRKAELQGKIVVEVDDRRTRVAASSSTPGVRIESDRGLAIPGN